MSAALVRPLVLGPLLGTALGDWPLGARLGVVCELFSLAEPVGARLPFNGSVAVCAALAFAAGTKAEAAAFPAALLVAWLYGRLESSARARRGGLGRLAEESLSRGEDPRLGASALSELLRRAALAVLLFGAAAALKPALVLAWSAAPLFLRAGLNAAWELAPWIGLGALIQTARIP